MKRQILISLLILLFVAAFAVAEDLPYKAGELIVRFADVQPGVQLLGGPRIIGPLSRSAIRDVISDFAVTGAFVHKEYDRITPGLTVVKLPEDAGVLDALVSFSQTAGVLYAEPNYKIWLAVVPNDTRFGELWGMNNIGQSGGTPDADIDAPEAWDAYTGSSSIVVAVTDTGVDYTHLDLAANMWVNPGEIPGNGIDDDGDGYVDDVYGCDTGDNDGNPMDNSAAAGHGTHVSGTIGAVGNNARGVAGVCWDVSIMAVKIADTNGDLWLNAIIEGIQYATDKGARVINASWGGYDYSQAEYDVIAAARNAGVIFVAAAGNGYPPNSGIPNNNDTRPHYPSSYYLNNIIAVMATTNTDGLAYYSNYGLTSVDLGAPGGEMQYSGDPRGILSTLPGNQYGFYQGTSMACPHVAGACALLLSIYPHLTYSEVKQTLLDYSDSLSSLTGFCVSGGRLNVFNVFYDDVPPSPDPAEWEIVPQATGLHTIVMEAKEATDRSGVEYFFECVTDANFNSGWQDGVLYERGDYAEGTTYTFRVKYRDKSDNQNETDWSSEESATTASGVDDKSPFPNPSQWKIKPKVIRLQPTPQVRMSAKVSTDENGPVEYYFTCTHVDPSGSPPPNPGWIGSTYTITSGLTVGKTYTFTVKARDTLHNETTASMQASVTVSGQGSNVLTVPTPYPTIQSAINAASNGDIVEVRPGTYRGAGNRDLDFGQGLSPTQTRAITVRSIDPNDPGIVAGTIIEVHRPYDLEQQVSLLLQGVREYTIIPPNRAFDFHKGETSNSIVAGFTITNGLIYSFAPNGSDLDANGVDGNDLPGGAIRCIDSSPTIRNCIINNCWVFGEFGGNGAPGVIEEEETIPGGRAGHGGRGMGGGIYCDYTSNAAIYNCTVNSCFAVGGYGGSGGHGEDVTDPNTAGGVGGNGGNGNDGLGGGICIDASSHAIISDCTISNCATYPSEGGPGGKGFINGLNGTDGHGFGGGVFYSEGYSTPTTNTKIIANEANNDGGGIYCMSFSLLTLTNCDISDNNCINGNGGGIWYGYGGELTLHNCDVSGNSAPAGHDGGGICAGALDDFGWGTTVVIDSNSTISGNSAGYVGGGLFLIKTDLTVNDSTISDNSAYEGAGAWLYDGTANVIDCTVRGNSATELGGGLAFIDSPAIINNSIMTGNSADGSVGGNGGALFFEGWSDNPHQVTNCLITDNTAYADGGGLSNNIGSWVRVINCTFSGNETVGIGGVGGGISCAEFWAYVEILNSILWDNKAPAGGFQIAVGDPHGSTPQGSGPYADVDVSYSDVQGGEDGVWLEDETQTYTALWWLDGSIDEDPLFATTDAAEPTYFLGQIASGQLQDSPCVDTGYGGAIPGTTRTDYVADSGTVDMGYHYEAGLVIPQYRLTIQVINQGYGTFGTVLPPWEPGTYVVNQGKVIELYAEPNDGWEVYQWTGTDYVPVNPAEPNYNTVTMDSDKTVTVEFGPSGTYKLVTHVIGNGTVEPAGLTIWPPDTVVPLTATPDNPSHRVKWTGSNDDFTTSLTNTVTMNTHKEVYVKFYEPRILNVPKDYTNIQLAIDDADDDDIVLIEPGTYYIYESTQDQGSRLLIDGKAITVTSVKPDDPCTVADTIIEGGFLILNTDRDTVINGLTITARYGNPDGVDGEDLGEDGAPGSPTVGAGMRLHYYASEPRGETIGSSSPTVKNCIFLNCWVGGSHGGDGAGGSNVIPGGDGGWAGWAQGGAVSIGSDSHPIFINCSFIGNSVRGGDGGDGGDAQLPANGGHGGNWGDPLASRWDYGPFDDYWRYSGYGGAVYCGLDSTPEFVDCNFVDNYAYGGSCGVSGSPVPGGWPTRHYRIDRFGGAVYCADGSSPVFTGCNFIDNEADVNGPATYHEGGAPDNLTVSDDIYISYGGAVAFENSATPSFYNCGFNDNLAFIGGGMWSTESSSDINDCNFAQNIACHGGGICFVSGVVEITRSDFSENQALYDTSMFDPNNPQEVLGGGGAICCSGGNATIADCDIFDNDAGGSGGGIYISGSSKSLVKNCLMTGNFALRDGGGISANWHSDVNVVNCTIADNSVTLGGTDTGFGGGLYCSYSSYVDIINSIIWDNFGTEGAQLALFTGFEPDARPSTADVKYSVIGPPGDVNIIYVDDSCTLNGWDPNALDPNNPWDPNTHNLRVDTDPLFVNGYFLSQVAAGQLVDSPCVDSGSTDANAPGIGLDTYTTRTDSVSDAGIVDMGYHYSPFTVPQYQLSFAAIGVDEPNWPVPVIIEPTPTEPNLYEGTHNWYETVKLRIDSNYESNYQVLWTGTDDDGITGPNNTIVMDSDGFVTVQFVKARYYLTIEVKGGNGRLFAEWLENGDPCETEAPDVNSIKFNTVVQLRAEPNTGYRVKRWIGTDDDTSHDPNNTVTIDSDRTVRVEFETPTILSVPGDYSSIQQALDAAGEGDTVLIAPGTYTTSTGYVIGGRNITISGVAPDDPCVVAATVINLEIGEDGYISTSAFTIYNVGPGMVFDGITIRGFSHRAYGGLDADEAGEDGYNGDHAFGGGIICYMASPTIKNCIIADCSVIGGNGGAGYNGSGSEPDDPNINGTDGGWPGKAYGGGLACLVNSSPTVINCTFDNCVAIGGNGGEGGNGNTSEDAYGDGGRGGGWYYGKDSRWYNVPWDRSSQGYYREGPVTNSFYDFYTEYTGRGGAVFVGEDCSPAFTHCTFTNNRTEGGTCGICGLDGWPPQHRPEPSLNWEIESFGGAVFCEANSVPTFVDCTFTGNTADVNYPNYNDDPYVGYGGAVAWEAGVNVVFENCTFNDNLASIGGAMYGESAYPSIVGCDLTANTAYHGGGLFIFGGASEIIQSNFSENEALYDTSITDSNSPFEVLGEGGAIQIFDVNAMIIDCNIFNNDAAGSGGGIYITGNSKPRVKNCLITDNIAGRDGGGISANWSSDSNIVNCTIVGNRVTGSGFDNGYGGGLYCSYGSYVNIVNSIIWDNLGSVGAQGSQLAVASGTNTRLNVTYSDIQGSTDPNAFGQRMDALDLVFCVDTTGSMGDDIAAVKTAARQITDAIADEIPDFRIAVVDYKDFNQPNPDPNADPYGDDADYPYRTVLSFTTDTNRVVNALNSLTASGGADIPESVYTAVMHCIDHNSLAGALEGELYGAAPNSVGPGAWRPGDVMRVIILMGDASPHDPEPFTGYTIDDIAEAAGGAEPKRIVPVLIGLDPEAGNYFRSLAGETGGTVLQAAGAEEVVGALMGAIELISQIPNPVFYDSNCVFNWDPNSYSWDPGSNNIDEDPCFIAGYYLSQFAAGQSVESNCIDGGKELAGSIGLDTYTTRSDSVSDDGIVDMGYHYKPFTVPQYKLTFEAIDAGVPGWPVPEIIEPVSAEPNYYEGMHNWYTTVQLRIDGNNYDPNIYQVLWTGADDDDISGPDNTVTMNGDKVVTVQFVKTKYTLTIGVNGGNGRLFAEWLENDTLYEIEAPAAYSVKFGTVVQLTAEPDEGYRVKSWSGTDDNSSRNPNNTVTMNSDKIVRVEFGLPVIVNVPQDYPTIQDAVSAAEEGDTIMVYPGTYYGGYLAVMVRIDKSVTIRSEHPDDPCCVAATIIDGYYGFNDYTNTGVVFAADAVLDGFTIQNCGGFVGNSDDGTRTDPCHPDGWDGGCIEGPAIYIYAGTSPVIKNCVIRDNLIIGGNGGTGVSAEEEYNAGRGGWAGWARGGAVYCGVNSSPKFMNCRILDNEARGGNGGNGGDYAEDGGQANYGGNWSLLGSSVLPVLYFDSDSRSITAITDRNLWEVLAWDWALLYWPMYGQTTRTSFIGDYRWYSGYGGGVYCDENSTVDFNNCTISGNIALGGMSGQGGIRGPGGRQQEPLVPYEIPSYGGGVYCAASSSVVFTSCTMTDNVSSPPAYIDQNDPGSGLRHRLDPYLGHGGGVCAEKTASVVFIDCTFSENEASLGGGMFWDDANAELIDSNIADNVAYKGGGVYFDGGLAEIVQSDFSRNDANGPAGEGGGIYCSDANVMIIDCNLIHNDANSSGGGIYISNSVAWLKNCLITSNSAGRDGGGVSANWYTESLITNCTFASNAAFGTFGEPDNTGFGGGFYCGYESNCEVTNSIFWDNLAIRGVEIAVHTGFEFELSPSILTISYSDVKGGQAGVRVDTGCTLNWLAGNIATDPLFVTGLLGDYYLSQTDSGQSQDSPCVDTGSDLATNLDMVVNLIDMTGYTTRTDDELDRGIVDMGYHYPSIFEICGFCNLFDRDLHGDPEGFIDFRDFAMFALHWLDVGCSGGNEWCEGADFTTDTVVDIFDLVAFVNCWLAEDTSAPVPNPSEWEDPPHETSPKIKMEAREAVDGWGWNVEYYFERLPLGEPNSGWRSSPTWEDTNVMKGTRYGYRVKTRDELGNEGEWSEIGYAGEDDVTPPAPIPYIDYIEPNITFITMTCSIASDDTGVEYYFDTNTPGAHDSGWISDNNYVDVNLLPDTTYAYRVQARDLSERHNTTNWSGWVYVTTLEAPETNPPEPDPAEWLAGSEPVLRNHYGGGADYWFEMEAFPATDDSGSDGIEYKFVCVTSPFEEYSSGWQEGTYYEKKLGNKANTYWYVIVRDRYNNTTDPSDTLLATIIP